MRKLYLAAATVEMIAFFAILAVAQDAKWTGDFSRALKIYDQGRYKEALPLLQDLAKRNAKDPTVHYKLGVALNRTGQKSLSEQEFHKVVELKEDFPNAQYNLGVTLSELGRPADAIPHLKRAVKLDPTDASSPFQLGKVLFNLDRFAEAEAEFRATINLRGDLSYAHFNLGQTLLKLGRCSEAVPMMRRASEVDRSDEDVWIRYAYVYECLRNWDEAANVYTTGLSEVPFHKRGELLLRRGAIYLAGGNAAQALTEMRNLLRTYGWASEIGAYGAVVGALASARSDGPESSRKFIQEAIAMCNPQLWPYDILLRLGRTTTATESFGAIWQRAESDAAFGYSLLIAGQQGKAKPLLESARPCAPLGSPLRIISDGALFRLRVDVYKLPACRSANKFGGF
jgi:tetratricopeptide (TPR) repeat protein